MAILRIFSVGECSNETISYRNHCCEENLQGCNSHPEASFANVRAISALSAQLGATMEITPLFLHGSDPVTAGSVVQVTPWVLTSA